MESDYSPEHNGLGRSGVTDDSEEGRSPVGGTGKREKLR